MAKKPTAGAKPREEVHEKDWLAMRVVQVHSRFALQIETHEDHWIDFALSSTQLGHLHAMIATAQGEQLANRDREASQ